jgi:hypothetical protein
MHGDSPRRLTFAGLIGIGVLAISAFIVSGAATSQVSPDDVALRKVLTTAILTDITVVKLPPGNVPGHVSAEAASQLHEKLVNVLPTVYAGELLTDKLQALSMYVDALKGSDDIAINTDARITGLTISAEVVRGSVATVQGEFTVWVKGRHKEDGALQDDEETATYAFTAGFDKVDGQWRVSSWSDQQL